MNEYMIKRRGKRDNNILMVDKCIAKEIQSLWNLGITTTGCCCGHNLIDGYIGVIFEEIPIMKELGYQVQPNKLRPNDEDSFYLKSINLCILD